MDRDLHIEAATPTADMLAPCWSCKGPVSRRALFCHVCSMIQPPQHTDHFTRLGLRQRFDLDAREIERNYFGFQRSVHPDRFAAKSAKEKAFSQAQAVAFNDAYETLRSPLSRAAHLLELRGHPLPADNATVDDPALLMAAMEARETLAEARTRQAVDEVLAAAQDDYMKAVDEISRYFAANDNEAARKALLRLRYLEKLGEEARQMRIRVAGKAM